MPPPELAALGPRPPFGSSPMMRPSANLGAAANASALVQKAVDLLEKALTDTPPQHPLHKTLLDAIGKLSKAAPPQAASPGVGLTAMNEILAQAKRQSPIASLLAGAAGGGAGGPPPMGGPPPIPTP